MRIGGSATAAVAIEICTRLAESRAKSRVRRNKFVEFYVIAAAVGPLGRRALRSADSKRARHLIASEVARTLHMSDD